MIQGHQSLQLHFKSKFGHEGEVLVTKTPLAAEINEFSWMASKFPREEDRFRVFPWAFRSAKHGWKYFLTLNSFPALGILKI